MFAFFCGMFYCVDDGVCNGPISPLRTQTRIGHLCSAAGVHKLRVPVMRSAESCKVAPNPVGFLLRVTLFFSRMLWWLMDLGGGGFVHLHLTVWFEIMMAKSRL